ncbi:cupin domain-containing protein [Candidatus Falkowbacteria bacterium CG_4_9_14_3_um_filter_36_9]|uniref:Cupin type-2 domain-containing protein n=2 Tax=Candidatus Falkowiibacteriota TaxID=1752728 RepID=A0A1J4T6Q6_9BACT|nr:MAG: hypothetical protein AUJ27_03050 [Candidatus Falkowbacteria bacterium CG1_02_37_44]PIV50235.1 MAG: cupin domain-containing protein [Candidatus Falkowbacteria bacterium CG02_land_8_20_14_3_00_36_14]PIX11802.1 MAG: cupin domain-containing protein [Candidatus Falkowbacteria bacterium CG_4_8_14_3_um_filter_36_11]PJA10933.1 MAG: cupin domain-containing protein [Candidatus Falkowbacteria bacterium CG_4_10_14_0_2_um_filter_36_22]PJB20488.1 MAG: cupin domain-containing protein [Candidatus Falko
MKKLDKNLYKEIEYPSHGILSKVILKNKIVEINLFCLAPKTEISEHTSAQNGLVLVLEGKGAFNLKGKNIVMEPGATIYMPQNAVHSLRVEKNTSFLLILLSNRSNN